MSILINQILTVFPAVKLLFKQNHDNYVRSKYKYRFGNCLPDWLWNYISVTSMQAET